MSETGAKARIVLTVNGERMDTLIDPSKTLLEVLREDLQLTGTKHGCELGECGACAVLVDGRPVLSCLALGVECEHRSVTTIEGLASNGALHPLQDAFADLGGSQCGYCTPGIILTAACLLDAEPQPSRDRIREALSGNLCRCTGYLQILDAVEEAAVRMPGLKTRPPSEATRPPLRHGARGLQTPGASPGLKTRPPFETAR